MSKRIGWLDGWRGLVCYLMIFYHLMFDFVMFGWQPYSITQQWPLFLLQRFIALSFIFLSGVSSHFTHSNLRRGLITLGCGVVVQVVATSVGAPIRYGILQFLGCAMIFYALFGKYVEKVPRKLAPWLWAALYLVTRVISYTTFVQPTWLYWLGLRSPGFQSYDWVPFIPNISMFFLGSWFAGVVLESPAESRLRTADAPGFLTWIGCRTLIVYMLHQPILYGGCWLVYNLL